MLNKLKPKKVKMKYQNRYVVEYLYPSPYVAGETPLIAVLSCGHSRECKTRNNPNGLVCRDCPRTTFRWVDTPTIDPGTDPPTILIPENVEAEPETTVQLTEQPDVGTQPETAETLEAARLDSLERRNR